ncbi:hypothetical protein ANTQUA_LOCUS5961 [Anthophora quadrimaculata]
MWLKIVQTLENNVEIIDHKFLISGHSFLPNDRDFGVNTINKATEFRLFVLYLGPIVLKEILPYYEHFLLFHAAIRILLYKKLYLNLEWLNKAREMLSIFVHHSSTLYGREYCIYNVPPLMHITDDVQNMKISLEELSCFPFENYLGKLKNMLRRWNKLLAQVTKRLSEKSIATIKAKFNWHSATSTTLTMESQWDEWKERFLETFADKGWSTGMYAINYKYKEGSLMEYAIRKEKLVLDMDKDISAQTLVMLIAAGLPEFIRNRIDKEKCESSIVLLHEIKKCEGLMSKNSFIKKREERQENKKKFEEKKPCKNCQKLNKARVIGSNSVIEVDLNTEPKNQ